MRHACSLSETTSSAWETTMTRHRRLLRDMGDDEDTSSEVAEGRGTRARTGRSCGWSWTCHVAWRVSRLAGPSFREGPGTCWGCACQEISLAHLSSSYSCSTHENKSNDIYMVYKIWRK